MLCNLRAFVHDALDEPVPAVPAQKIRQRARAIGTKNATKWSSITLAAMALLLFVFAPVTQTRHSVPTPAPAPAPTIT